MIVSICFKDVTISAAIQLHCLAMTLLSNSQNLQKWKLTLSSSMAMYSVMRDIYDARRVPMEREWVALYLCRMQIFKSIAFRTTGLWNGLPLFDTHCIEH